MARVYSRDAEPHRVLTKTGGDLGPQRGEDVEKLHHATARRLSTRGITRPLGPDNGEMNVQLYQAAKTAAHFLGVPDTWHDYNGLLIREQRVIRFPGTRTPEMLQAAADRMDKLTRTRAAAQKKADAASKNAYSGLTDSERVKARQISLAAFRLAFEHRDSVHYTQAAARWSGINQNLRYASGQYPKYADCSSMYTWCLWNGLTSVGGMNFADIVNGADWKAGYTGTLLSHGVAVKASELMPGDAVIYGTSFPGEHVAMYAGAGKVYSHGSEAGPFLLAYNYRSDILAFRRYI